MLKLSCGLSFGDPGSPKPKREHSFKTRGLEIQGRFSRVIWMFFCEKVMPQESGGFLGARIAVRVEVFLETITFAK